MSIQAEIKKSFTTVRQEIRPVVDDRKNGESWSTPVLILVLVLEFCFLLIRARSKVFWYDELITFHLSGLQTLSRLRDALGDGADSMSLGYYLIVRLARMLPVDLLIAMRLPSILGYLAGLLGIYWFVTRKLPAMAGFAAVLLMTLSSYRWYATEARSYGLTVGLLAISLALWQRIDAKRFGSALFGLTLFFAVASYSLAIFAIGCFAAAEIVLAIRARQCRWGVWMAFAIATVPFFAELGDIEHLRRLYAAHFWARASWSVVITASGEYFEFGQRMTPLLVVFCLAGVVWLVRGALRNRRKSHAEFTLPELILIGAFLVYPACLVIFMKIQGTGYTPRYGLPGILGLVPVLVYIGWTQCSRKAFRWATAALTITFTLQMAHDFQARTSAVLRTAGERWATLERVGRERPELPIVISSAQEFFEESEYGPADLKARTVNLSDRDASDRLLGSDSSDIEDLILAQFDPVRFEPARPFLAEQAKFVLLSGAQEDWLTAYLVEKQYRLSLVGTDSAGPVYIAER